MPAGTQPNGCATCFFRFRLLDGQKSVAGSAKGNHGAGFTRQVWEAWDVGEIDDRTAWVAWWNTVVTQMSEDRLT